MPPSDPTPSPIPPSSLYTLRTTLNSGRGVYASTIIPKDTLILNTSTSLPTSASTSTSTVDHNGFNNILNTNTPTRPVSSSTQTADNSPLAWVISRPYRKEVCANCFAYNRGRDHKTKPAQDSGVVFCSPACLESWEVRNGKLGIQAWTDLEAGVKSHLRRVASADATNAGADAGNANDTGNADGDGENEQEKEKEITEEEIDNEWERASLVAQVVTRARLKGDRSSRNERRVVRNVVERGGDPGLMYFLLTGVIEAWRVAEGMKRDSGDGKEEQPQNQIQPQHQAPPDPTPTPTPTPIPVPVPNPDPNSPPKPPIQTLLPSLFTLTSTNTAYANPHTTLQSTTTAHLYLLTLLPLELIEYLTPLLTHNLITRAAHNAFSLRPSSSSSSSSSTTSSTSTSPEANANTSDGTDSGEFLGYAIYTAASFFNHSCAPNLRKMRTGRVFEFFAERDVKGGEELCISYLGGEEGELGVLERRARLSGEWGFVCGCVRCVLESGSGTRNENENGSRGEDEAEIEIEIESKSEKEVEVEVEEGRREIDGVGGEGGGA